MRHTLLFFFALIFTYSHSQCTVPPPLGGNEFYMLDTDNDGFASFDIDYYINHVERPMIEQIYGVSSSGYNLVGYTDTDQLMGAVYTNIVQQQFCWIHYEYTGTGPVFPPLPPCFWQVPTLSGMILNAVPFDGDMDNDGILNAAEDLNGNLNLMDDDGDHDGVINLLDNSNSVAELVQHNWYLRHLIVNGTDTPAPATAAIPSIPLSFTTNGTSYYMSTSVCNSGGANIVFGAAANTFSFDVFGITLMVCNDPSFAPFESEYLMNFYQNHTGGIFSYNITEQDNVKTLTITSPDNRITIYNDQLLGVKDYQAAVFDVSPVPAADFLTIEMEDGASAAAFEIYDAMGRLCIKEHFTGMTGTVNVQQLSKGLYLLKVKDGEKVGVRKFLKE